MDAIESEESFANQCFFKEHTWRLSHRPRGIVNKDIYFF